MGNKPARISRSSKTGVSRAVPPWRLKTSAIVAKMRSRSSASAPDQSLVPFGVLRLNEDFSFPILSARASSSTGVGDVATEEKGREKIPVLH
jgi:hypothetical protein